ncbi:SDR family NAD(P)-dependent oxidoreductase [Sphingomonas montanisoli]|uniref:SDR family oxidoreductase n=1 Tax=Sphingomonas montanisoli TaxID=2606412 RepID=A0A5D9C984_9SPHN|nr:SDR family oxidoreductase [Sphingomonas montanisoli]TZG27827.1 SDR family oxidoreductase [Sphingomonas montanisoli]
MTIGIVAPDAVLLVVGGTGAIGIEIAAQAAEGGARVIVHGSREESCAKAIETLAARCPEGGFTPLIADLTAPGSSAALVEKAVAVHGRLDALIHAAGYGPAGAISGPLSRTDPAAYGAFLEMGVASFQEMCHAALPHLSETRGAIVAFASDSGLFAAPRQSLVAARMAAIIAFVRNLGLETARDGVRINCISPSYVEQTPIFDRFLELGGGRVQKARDKAGLGLPTPADIAPLALFLCGPLSTKITGQIISINGGLNA